MGNCYPKGLTVEGYNLVRILTDSGGILEFKGPKLAKDVLKEYPGYCIFSQGQASSPLCSHEYLLGGQFYHLLPLDQKMQMSDNAGACSQAHNLEVAKKLEMERVDRVESSKMSSSARIEKLANGSSVQVLPSQGNGVWRVKLVMTTKQLEEILSEQENTEALIEKMRMAATSSTGFKPRQNKSSGRKAQKRVLC